MTLCAHFGNCGGCAFQNLPDQTYRMMKHKELAFTLAQNGLTDVVIEDIIGSAPATRRRANLKVQKKLGVTEIGFYAARSHNIVDMRECRVMTPALTALVPGLRDMMHALLHDGEKAELHVTETDTGFDVVLDWKRLVKSALIAELAPWAQRLNFARISDPKETLVELRAPAVRFGKATVKIPPQAFLQPTRDGEAALQALVLQLLKGAKNVLELFAGCGTFTLVLAEKSRVVAIEQDSAMLNALAAAARATQGLKPITTEKRDLFKSPLGGMEFVKFDAVLLDPPRAGAPAQAKALARSKVPRIAYVSCNADSFARDARVLVDGGYKLSATTPVDQFLWSSHIELVAGFTRSGGK